MIDSIVEGFAPMLPASTVGSDAPGIHQCWVRLQSDPSPMIELVERWDSLWERLEIEPRGGLFETAVARWSEPHRAYHTPQHLLECLRILDHLRLYCTAPAGADAVEFALWYHDIIHSPRQQDNEERSAELALSTFVKSGGTPILGESIRKIVLATNHRDPVRTVEAAVAVDADLAILGAPVARFDEYERQVRKEYAQVDDRHYAAGRLKILQSILGRNQIYRTPRLRDQLENQARSNLAGSILQLSAMA